MAAGNARVGSMFGKYKLNGLLGQGGMGEVYEAYDTSKDRTVALKILPEELSHDERFRTRFQRESHAAASLEEPHVIPIHDWGEIGGNLFIEMRLVRGENLHDVLKRGPLDPARAVAIIRQIASALDVAHARGLIHRDIKPQNILVTSAQDFAYLIDFGIAANRGDTRLTVAGSAIGSFAYMAPERFDDRPATPAVDVYSLAAVLYEALTGRPPFRPGGMEQLIAAHLATPPPRPSLANPRVPVALDDVVARGMAKEPDDRYGSPGALGRAAQRALQEAPAPGLQTGPNAVTRQAPAGYGGRGPYDAAPTRPAPRAPQDSPGRSPRWVVPAVAVAAAVLLLGGVGVVIGLLARPRSGPATATAPSISYPVPGMTHPYQPPPRPGPPSPPAPALPPAVTGPDNTAGREFCDDGYSLSARTGFGTHSKRGDRQTSCFFAKSVLIAYWNRYGDASRESRTVSAPGAVPCPTVGGGAVCDGVDFVMECAAYGFDNWITCRGGNGAVVYLY